MSRILSAEAYAAHQARYGRWVSQPIASQAAPQMTLRTVAFTLAMPPSVNEAWHYIRATGGKTLTDAHRAFRSNTIARVRAAVGRMEPLAGRIELIVRLKFSNNRYCDIDNRIKPLQDALTHAGAYHDDSQIDKLIVWRQRGAEVEACEVELREVAA